ncbi:MAG: methylenetetrahydrofolate--tRNA-(uracil(54)-C(5))-methyltransferase (FADH(2)-oxidizing) TrmFO, partial [Synergistaceae bacterium]|nr:methylenetetrahydrofolate--tRNA-(uracil(54)-C(5))-methyltransferase (FADH(2)-oxidizing) TrmFO [Synergistaceae bacterium]
MTARSVSIVGGGLAGSEAAWQLAARGVRVRVFEMRPARSSPAHVTGNLAELVCSNSLGADMPISPAGILKQELRRLGSLIINCAERTRVPAGRALAVDRDNFSSLVTSEISRCPNIELIRAEVAEIPEGPAIIATGPLMTGGIAGAIREIVGEGCLSFFDAAAPIVTLESVDMGRAYRASRYGEGDDYVNCPMEREQYEAFWRELASADRVPLSDIDVPDGVCAPEGRGDTGAKFFEGCLPVEVMAERGMDTLRFGPMRPVGLPDPASGREPYAVVQLRRDNAEGTLYNMVGFQTNLRWPEQERVFRM